MGIAGMLMARLLRNMQGYMDSHKHNLRKKLTLRSWLWLAFSRHALIPLLIVESLLVIVYIISANTVTDRNISYLRETAVDELSFSSERYSAHLDNKFASIERGVRLYADAVVHALENDNYQPTEDEINRLQISELGVLHDPVDRGGAAVFYPQPQQGEVRNMAHVYRLNATESLMKSLVTHNELVVQVYFNQTDSFNYIYPYFDVLTQYPHDVDVRDFAFFYLADPINNPERELKWTQVYLDPAGQGWMTSATYPIYLADEFTGVVGFDIAIRELISEVESVSLPWNGFAMLVDEQQNVVALADAAAKSLGLDVLPKGRSERKIGTQLTQSQQHNLNFHPSYSELVTALQADKGVQQFTLNGTQMMVGWATIDNTQWKLLTFVDESSLFAQTNSLATEMRGAIYWMIAGLIVFYIFFFLYIRQRAWKFSKTLHSAVDKLIARVKRIESRDYAPEHTIETELLEINELGQQIESMAAVLNDYVERLAKNEQRLSEALQTSGDIVLEYNYSSDRIGYLQPLWRWLGYVSMPDEMGLKEMIPYIHPEDRDDPAFKNVMLEGIGFNSEFRMKCRDGSWLWIQARKKAARKANGELEKQVITLTNIQHRKLTEQHLRVAKEAADDANRAKSMFLSSVTHELKTPLSAIIGFTQLLGLDPLTPSQQQSLEQIQQGSRHLQRLIDDILTRSEIEANTLSVELKPLHAETVVQNAVEWIKTLAEQKGVRITVVALDCAPFLGDPQRVQQVLINVLSNAVKYNRERGNVYITCADLEGWVQIDIRDEGYGIDIDKLEKIFEPFMRLERDTHLVEGTGIGLTICRDLMARMQGHISVCSTLDKGTMFTLRFQKVETQSDESVTS